MAIDPKYADYNTVPTVVVEDDPVQRDYVARDKRRGPATSGTREPGSSSIGYGATTPLPYTDALQLERPVAMEGKGRFHEA